MYKTTDIAITRLSRNIFPLGKIDLSSHSGIMVTIEIPNNFK
jgi:hypothetical protein